jgi:hypothetical protein
VHRSAIVSLTRRITGHRVVSKKPYRDAGNRIETTVYRNGSTHQSDTEFIDLLRQSNDNVTDRHEPGCWVIGDQSFVKSALEHDHENRLRIASYRKHGWTIQKIVADVARQMKIDSEDILKRGRVNERSIFRKIAAALSYRVFGIPIIEIARFYGIGSSSVSRMLDKGERYAIERNISLKQ